MRSPLMMEGPKTIAGEYKTVSERSFVMVSSILFVRGDRAEWCRSSRTVSPDSSLERSVNSPSA